MVKDLRNLRSKFANRDLPTAVPTQVARLDLLGTKPRDGEAMCIYMYVYRYIKYYIYIVQIHIGTDIYRYYKHIYYVCIYMYMYRHQAKQIVRCSGL